MKGSVFTVEYIENASVKVYDLDGNRVIEREVLDTYTKRVQVPGNTTGSFDIPEEQEKTDALASVVEESFHSEQILVNLSSRKV
ncbi:MULTISPECIES: hypothetical protein [unclassified Mesotoga]|uniref:hypothetical protein n=1 Tax=unclassified Mesotoga TaxID=1184398 RepID=UPI0011B73B18|nr:MULTISPECIES: hypothetical protein [unclassified Mesotoga]